jgi:Icc protein
MRVPHLYRLCGWLLSLAFLSSCDLIDYHPYAGNIDYKNLTQENLHRIKELEASYSTATPLRFAFTGDTQGYYTETEDMVADMNRRDIAFVLHAGDLTNYAFTDEFERMHKALSKLKVPYLTVVGNHDCLGEGKKLYQRMYGPFDYSFTFAQNKFIFLNTNFLEFDDKVPDVTWLEQELKNAPGTPNKFVISHMAPNNSEANPNKEQKYASLMRQYDVQISMHGHTHNYRLEDLYKDGIPYLTVDAALKRSYMLVTVIGSTITLERIKF